MRQISVRSRGRGCRVLIGAGLLSGVGGAVRPLVGDGKAVLVTVPPVRDLYLQSVLDSLADAGVEPLVLTVPDGEEAKTPGAYLDVVGRMLDAGAGRDALVISLGGGCVGDLSGFVASTYMRGIGLVHVPTTLLAQVDSSIGGKSALNHPRAKNLIGSFHQPELVIADTRVLRTLPPKEVRCGLAEVLKYGAILDSGLFGLLEARAEEVLGLNEGILEEVVCRSAEIKARVVAADETDMGERMLLNFGHTVGHAIEAATGYIGYSHGEAVAIGMVAEARIASKMGMIGEGDVERIVRLATRFGLPTRARGVSADELILLMHGDKKVRGGELRFALPDSIGSGSVVEITDRGLITEAISGVLGD
ncbi:MAG: 3-dehydroquinate synthase [Candidatus Methanosuratincola petrocarbonis]